MELTQLLQNPTQGVNAQGEGSAKGAAQNGQGSQGAHAGQLAQTASRLEVEAHKAYSASQELDHTFRLNPALKEALHDAVSYMNRTLEHDGLKMNIEQKPETPDELQIFVKNGENGKIVKEYAPQDVLRYYAYSGYGSGLVIDGKI